MKLETSLAKSARKREDTRDPLKNYNKLSFKQFTGTTPNLNWTIFMEGVGLHNVDTVIIGQPEFLKAVNGYLKSFTLNDWKNYLKFHLLSGLSRYLDDKTYNESFSFYYTVLRGVKEPKPRWKRVVTQTDGSLGELIGQVYVNEYLPKGTKNKLHEIGNAIKAVYAERMKNLDWMSEATKKKAVEKLNAVIMKVGWILGKSSIKVSTDPIIPIEPPLMTKPCKSAVIPKECAHGSMEMARLFSVKFKNQARPALTFSARFP